MHLVAHLHGGKQIFVQTLTAMKRVLSWATLEAEFKGEGKSTGGKGSGSKGKDGGSGSDSYGDSKGNSGGDKDSFGSKGSFDDGKGAFGSKGKSGGGSDSRRGDTDKSGGNVGGCGIIHSKEDDKRGWPDTFVMEGERWSCTGARRLTDAERSAAEKELGCPQQ